MSSNNEEIDHEANKAAWKSEQVLNLANHFHTYCGDDNQHKRVHHFEISEDHLSEFTNIEEIDTLKISLAIGAAGDDTDFRFYPVLEVTQPIIDAIMYFPLEPTAIPDNSGFLSEIVPGIFKEMVLDNWNKLDITYIDDLFIAQAWDEENEESLNHMVRVHEFIIDKEMMVPFINELNTTDGIIANITNIKLYPGVDMNKFGNTEFISFTPVLSFTHRSANTQLHSHPGSIEALRYETLVEYSLPCPPCRKKKK